MPPEAKVAVFEDDPLWLKVIRRELERDSHRVVIEAKSLEDALDALKTFRDKGVNVVVLGGNLGGEFKDVNDPDNDSQRIIHEMQTAGLDEIVETVGLSGRRMPNTTVDLGKDHVIALGRVVTSLK